MASLKTASRRTSTGRTYRDVDEMLRHTGYRRVAAAVKSLSAKTRLVDQLILARVVQPYPRSTGGQAALQPEPNIEDGRLRGRRAVAR